MDFRCDFPIFQNNPDIHYLDSAATSLKPKCVVDKMDEYYYKYGVNIHRGAYRLSYDSSVEYDKAKAIVANFINADQSEIVFVRNATEGLNIASLMVSQNLKKGDHVLTSPLDHHSAILPWMKKEEDLGLVLDYVDLDEGGRISLKNIKKSITKDTKVICMTYASNTLGYITDMKSICEYAHSFGIIVIVDAAQYIPHFRVDVKDIDCDFLVFSAHKMMGPTGIGVLYGKKNLLKSYNPVLYGGDMNADVDYHKMILKEAPDKYEAGTPAIAEAIGLGEACNYLNKVGYEYIQKKEKELLEYAHSLLKNIEGLTIYNTNPDLGLILFNIDGVHPHDAATIFDNNNVCVRAGHHCAELVSKYLNVNGTLRASLYFYNTFEDIDALVKSIKEVIEFFKQFN